MIQCYFRTEGTDEDPIVLRIFDKIEQSEETKKVTLTRRISDKNNKHIETQISKEIRR